MSIRKWHVGKLVILWAWGGTVAGLVLADFQSSSVESGPWKHLAELVFIFVAALVLSAITWVWLGDRRPDTGSAEKKADL